MGSSPSIMLQLNEFYACLFSLKTGLISLFATLHSAVNKISRQKIENELYRQT